MPNQAHLAAIRAQIAAVEAGTRTAAGVLSLGHPAIDGCFAHGGFSLGAWHELTAEGMQVETGAAPAAFAARLARAMAGKAVGRIGGEVVWVMRRDDLYPPGLSHLGLAAQRLIQVKTRDDDQLLAVLEEALSAHGVAVAVGEVEAVPLTAGRRLQLACERGGATGLVIQRRPYGGRKALAQGSAAASRWKIAPAPSAAGLGGSGLGPPRWAVELLRSRGGRPGAWILEEASDGPHPFRLAAEVAGDGLAPPDRLRAAG